MEDRNYIMIDGVRYHADRPADCRFCQFWKNRRRGCILGRENCYYLAQVVITEEERKCEGCRYAVGAPCVSACCYGTRWVPPASAPAATRTWNGTCGSSVRQKLQGGRTVMGKKTGDIRRAEKLIQKKERQTKKAKADQKGQAPGLLRQL